MKNTKDQGIPQNVIDRNRIKKDTKTFLKSGGKVVFFEDGATGIEKLQIKYGYNRSLFKETETEKN